MAEDKLPITVQGKEQLETELKKLITEERPTVIKAIEEARAHGDLSENAEYDAAKEKQALVEGRIQEIQGKLVGVEVINTSELQSDRVVFGAHVVVCDLESEEETSYQIVGVDEADVKEGKISIISPLARAMIGKSKGDDFVLFSPKGEKEYEIIDLFFK